MMANQSEDLMAQNLFKIEEAKSASLTSSIYKRGVPSALPSICPLVDCGKVISRPREVLSHIQSIHKQRHMFWCCKCELFFPRPSDLERHGLYLHQIPEWSTNSLSTKVYTLVDNPPFFNAKKYLQGLTKADIVLAPYPKVTKKRRASASISNAEKRVKLSETLIGAPTAPSPVVAIQSPLGSVDAPPCLDTSSSVLLEVRDEVPDWWKASYNALAESVIKSAAIIADLTRDSEESAAKITDLTRDSDEVCTQLSLSKANCEKLEDALRVAQEDAKVGRIEAQGMHMQLIASQNEVKVLKGDAEKASKCHSKGLERLGSREGELVELRKSHSKLNIDLTETRRLNSILKKKDGANNPLPQPMPAENVFKAPPKVHFVGLEEKVKALEAQSGAVLLVAVSKVFDVLYSAIEYAHGNVTDGYTAADERVTAKSIVDECYHIIFRRTRDVEKTGFLPVKFAFRPNMS